MFLSCYHIPLFPFAAVLFWNSSATAEMSGWTKFEAVELSKLKGHTQSEHRGVAQRPADRHRAWAVSFWAETPLNRVHVPDERLCLQESGHQAVCFVLEDGHQNPTPLSKMCGLCKQRSMKVLVQKFFLLKRNTEVFGKNCFFLLNRIQWAKLGIWVGLTSHVIALLALCSESN